jgi:hypothetical protein
LKRKEERRESEKMDEKETGHSNNTSHFFVTFPTPSLHHVRFLKILVNFGFGLLSGELKAKK